MAENKYVNLFRKQQVDAFNALSIDSFLRFCVYIEELLGVASGSSSPSSQNPALRGSLSSPPLSPQQPPSPSSSPSPSESPSISPRRFHANANRPNEPLSSSSQFTPSMERQNTSTNSVSFLLVST